MSLKKVCDDHWKWATLTTSLQVTKAARERDSAKRASYVIEISKYQRHELVFVDESSFDRRVSLRNRGWALVGQRTVLNTFFVKGKRYNVLSSPYAMKFTPHSH